jgi:hypothetical protein
MVFSFPKGRKKEISGMRRRPAPPRILKKSSKSFARKFVCSQEMMMHAHHQFNPSSSAQRKFQRKRMESLGMRRRRCCQLIRELAL